MCQDVFEFNRSNNARLCMLIMCSASKEFIKVCGCGRNTKFRPIPRFGVFRSNYGRLGQLSVKSWPLLIYWSH